MNINELVEEGFTFGKIEMDEDLRLYIENLNYISHLDNERKDRYEKRAEIPRGSEVEEKLRRLFREASEDESLRNVLKTFHFDVVKFDKGDDLYLHRDLDDEHWFHALTWVVPDEYEGREFLYGTEGNIKEFKPKMGDACLINTFDPAFWHGVGELRTSLPVYSISGH